MVCNDGTDGMCWLYIFIHTMVFTDGMYWEYWGYILRWALFWPPVLTSLFAALVTNPSTEQSDLRFQKKMINRRQLLEKISLQKLLQQALPILNYLPRMMEHVFKVLFVRIFTNLMRLIRWVTGQVNHWSRVDRTNTALRWWKDYWWWRN